MEGVVSSVVAEQGRGVIVGADDKEYPFERGDLEAMAFEDLVEGAAVEFELEFQALDMAHGAAPEQARAVNVKPATIRMPEDGLAAG